MYLGCSNQAAQTAAASQEQEIQLSGAQQEATANSSVYVGDFVSSMTSMLDKQDIAYEIGSKMGGNAKADFENGVYGYPFFQGDTFYVIAMTDDNDNVETVNCTLKGDDVFSETNLNVLESSVRSFAANLTNEEIQQAAEKIKSGEKSAAAGDIQFSAEADDSGVTVGITWVALG